MNRERMDNLLFGSLFLTTVGMVVAQTLGKSDLTSSLFVLTFPLTVLLWLRAVKQSLTGTDLLMLLTVGLAAVNVFVNAGATNTLPGFAYVKKLIMFSMTLMFFQTAYRTRVQPSLIRFFNTVVDLLSIYLIVLFFLQPIQMYTMGERVSQYLTFRFANPNQTGMFLSCLCILELYRLFAGDKWYRKVLSVTLSVFLAVFVILTQSRNALLILTLFAAACVVLFFRGKKEMKLGKFWAVAIAVFPIVFVIFYVTVVYAPWFQRTFSFLVDEGKHLDSRMDVWKPALENLFASPFIGAYSQISNGTGEGQMHNTHLDIACSYGIPVMILVCVLLYRYLYQNGRYYSKKGNYVYILGFACLILLGIGEAALFSGGLGIYVLVGSFLLMVDKESDEDNEAAEQQDN